MGKKGDITKDGIRCAARRLFCEQGFKQVSMQDICRETGLSRGGLYRHYGDTGQIMKDLVAEQLDRQQRDFDEKLAAGVPPREILEAFLTGYRLDDTGREGSLALATCEYYSTVPEEKDVLYEQYLTLREMLVRLLRQGAQQGAFAELDAEVVADLLLFARQGAQMLGNVMPVPKTAPDNVTTILKELVLK